MTVSIGLKRLGWNAGSIREASWCANLLSRDCLVSPRYQNARRWRTNRQVRVGADNHSDNATLLPKRLFVNALKTAHIKTLESLISCYSDLAVNEQPFWVGECDNARHRHMVVKDRMEPLYEVHRFLAVMLLEYRAFGECFAMSSCCAI